MHLGRNRYFTIRVTPKFGSCYSRKVYAEYCMSELSRIGVAIDSDLLEQFDRFINGQGYENRSEAFRDLIRERLVSAAVETPEAPVVGSVTLIYDHHSRLLPEKLMELQHDHHDLIIATTHAHLDHETCLEVVVVKGKSKRVRALADLMISTKGVHHGRLVMSAPTSYHSKSE
jgi:CopG family nickel-responsive transcriptional regulator